MSGILIARRLSALDLVCALPTECLAPVQSTGQILVISKLRNIFSLSLREDFIKFFSIRRTLRDGHISWLCYDPDRRVQFNDPRVAYIHCIPSLGIWAWNTYLSRAAARSTRAAKSGDELPSWVRAIPKSHNVPSQREPATMCIIEFLSLWLYVSPFDWSRHLWRQIIPSTCFCRLLGWERCTGTCVCSV